MGNKKQSASASVEKKAQEFIGWEKFPKITSDNLKQSDKKAYSALFALLAKSACIEVPLAIGNNGKEIINAGSVERVFYSLYIEFDKKLKLSIVKKSDKDADSFYLLQIDKLQNEVEIKTRAPLETEKKVMSSKKRVARAEKNRAQAQAETQKSVEEQAQADCKALAEKNIELEKTLNSDSTDAEKKQAREKTFDNALQALLIKNIPDINRALAVTMARDIMALARKYVK